MLSPQETQQPVHVDVISDRARLASIRSLTSSGRPPAVAGPRDGSLPSHGLAVQRWASPQFYSKLEQQQRLLSANRPVEKVAAARRPVRRCRGCRGQVPVNRVSSPSSPGFV